MSDINADFADSQQWHQRQDDDSHPRDTYTAEDEARMYAAWEKRQQELDAMTRDASGQVIRPVRQAVARFDRSKWTSEQWAVIQQGGAA
jgi:hypothetical protein